MSKQKKDFLPQCNSGEIRTDPETFKKTWCVRCSNPECLWARYAATDPLAERQRTWRQEFFEKPLADTRMPKYAHIAGLDFQNLLEKAVKLEISSQRGDWSVPEINISDGKLVKASPEAGAQVEAAVRQLTQQEQKAKPPSALEEPAPEKAAPVPVEASLPVSQPKPLPKSPKVTQLSSNTPDPGSVMVGGEPYEVQRPPPKTDPWALPEKKAKAERIVDPGATIVLGGTKKKK